MKSITTKKNIKPNTLISKRDSITSEIAKLWKIIATENVIRKGLKRNYNMEGVLLRISGLYDELVTVKLRIQCANMGMKFKDLPLDANVINIYKLSAQNEYYVKLDEMMKKHTISPTLKAKKGKRALSVTEELTYNKLRTLRDNCSLTLNELRKKIAEFNDNTEIPEDEAPMLALVA